MIYDNRQYPAKVTKVYDGDTITVQINLGFDISILRSVRFVDINCLEVRGEEREQGLIARNKLREKLPIGTEVLIETTLNSKKRDKCGRYKRPLVKVYLKDESISEWMVAQGVAVWRD